MDLGERESKHGEERRKEEEEKKKRKKKKITGMETMGVCIYGLEPSILCTVWVWGIPKLISCMVELRRALRLLDMCFEKGPVTSRTQKIPCFRSYAVVES